MWVIAGIAIIITFIFLQKAREKKRSAFIKSYNFPEIIIEQVRFRYPHLSDKQISLAIEGLREYFILQGAGGFIFMPSQVVDVTWQEFILSIQQYEEFCQNAFGHLRHHKPAEAMNTPKVQDGIQRAWTLACEHEGMNAKSPGRLPRLFAIDTLLTIPDGFHYVLDCAVLDEKDHPQSDRDTATHNKRPTYCAAHIAAAVVAAEAKAAAEIC